MNKADVDHGVWAVMQNLHSIRKRGEEEGLPWTGVCVGV
jgi:hypothetical protein